MASCLVFKVGNACISKGSGVTRKEPSESSNNFFFLLKSVGSFFEVGNMGPQNAGSAPGKTISSFATEEILVKYKFYSFYLEI